MNFVIIDLYQKKSIYLQYDMVCLFFVNYEILKKKTGTIISADVKSGSQVFSQLCVENAVQELSLKCKTYLRVYSKMFISRVEKVSPYQIWDQFVYFSYKTELNHRNRFQRKELSLNESISI
jgi:hypothetical protein